MARTIAEIKKEITDRFMSFESVKLLYGLDETKTFEQQFSTASIESVLFYCVAACVWTLETLFDLHKNEVTDTISNLKPGRAKWYRNKVLAFQKDYLLPEDSDTYAVIDEAARVVKYCAVVEAQDSSKLQIKIAGGDALRDKLDDATEVQVKAYINWVRYAGVRIELINQSPDKFKCEVDIHYNAMLMVDNVRNAVREAIVGYIENLSFNGEYSNMALTDALQAIDGVVIPELKAAYSKPVHADYDFSLINTKRVPDAGYFRAYNDTDITINMIPYELLQD
ncbi:hypothetical protein [Dysgonomonas sp. 520]|uniref:hypothetical protein n=1 Tax=Dysgonomonas sp. 520 TaxID=2302931 RepID=UPI0013D3699F|nr:hypothetical protein [Dysgonomonas sp. 520]NDW10443.1 hypothetical protein [Dysgonomonas sp. 520]